MKLALSITAILATPFVSLATAQSAVVPTASMQQLQQSMPPCALNCMISELAKSTCSQTDNACLCANKDLSNALLPCVALNCTVIAQLQTKRFQSTTCGEPMRNISQPIGITMWTLFAIAIVAITCRGIVNLPQSGGTFTWDDLIILLCLLGLFPATILAQLMQNNGFGQDIWMLTPTQITNILFFLYIELYMYCLLITLTKLSILILYLRIFPGRSFGWICYMLIILSVLLGVSSIIVQGLQCRPIRMWWEGWDGSVKGVCLDLNASTFAFSAINMALDIAIFLLPIPSVLRLQMHYRKKIGVVLMFATGLVVTICSIVRLPTILKYGKTTNPTYDYGSTSIWSFIEMILGIICACIPGVAAFLRRFWPSLLTKTRSTTNGGASGPSRASHHLGTSYAVGSSPHPKKIHSRTMVSIGYEDAESTPDSQYARSDEFELMPHM